MSKYQDRNIELGPSGYRGNNNETNISSRNRDNGQPDRINYEAFESPYQGFMSTPAGPVEHEQQQQQHPVDSDETTGDEEGAESYRKVPIKDLINSFENQSRPVMRYKLADEQIIKKVYNKAASSSANNCKSAELKEAAHDAKRDRNQVDLLDKFNSSADDYTEDEDCYDDDHQRRTELNYDDICKGIRLAHTSQTVPKLPPPRKIPHILHTYLHKHLPINSMWIF